MTVVQTRSPGGASEAKQDATITALSNLLTELQSKINNGGTVALDAPTIAALQSVVATVSGTVALDAPTLAALEQITATVANFPSDYPDASAHTLLTAIRDALLGTLAVSGSVELGATTLAALETINAVVQNWPAEYPLPAAQVATLTPQTNALTQAELVASEVGVYQRSARGVLPYSQVLTAGDTLTPSVGKALNIVKVQVIANPFNTTSNLVQFTLPSLSATPFLQGWVFSSNSEWTGATNESLSISLENAQPVSVNIQYKEV